MAGHQGGRTGGGREPRAGGGAGIALAVAAVLLLGGLLGALTVLARRAAVEGPRAGPVELVMDWEGLIGAASEWNVAPDEALSRLAREGITTVALTELTAAELAARGRALLLSADQLQALAHYVAASTGALRAPTRAGGLGDGLPGAGPGTRPALPLSDGQAPLAAMPPLAGQAPPGVTGEGIARPGDGGTWLLAASGPPRWIPAELPRAGSYRVGFPREGWEAARRAGVAVMLRYGDGPRLAGDGSRLGGDGTRLGGDGSRLAGDGARPADGALAQAGLDGVAGYAVPPDVPLSRVSIFVGDKLPAPEEAAALLGRLRAALGMVEFGRQEGLREVVRQFDLDVATVHSARAEELQTLGPKAAADRYVRAVRERGIRVLYLRPLESLEQTVEMVARIREGLRQYGYAVGRFAPRPAFTGPGPWQAAGMAAALPGLVLAGWLAWLHARGSRPDGAASLRAAVAALALAAAVGAVVAALRAGGWDRPLFALARQALALAAALAGPPAALGAALAIAGSGAAQGSAKRPHRAPAFDTAASESAAPDAAAPETVAPNAAAPDPTQAATAPVRVVASWLAFVAVSLLAGLLVGALLSDDQFMLRLELFRGVKMAHAVPLLVSAALGVWVAARGPTRWRSALQAPVRWRDAALALAILVAVAYYLARTGNELAPVPAVERWLRGWLEGALEVRPRTKEFLVGYPALALTLLAWRLGLAFSRPWLFAAGSAAASVAAISVINSWAHVHTPVEITLLRVVNGFVAGAVTALLAWAAASRWASGRRVMAEGGASPEGRPVGVLRVR